MSTEISSKRAAAGPAKPVPARIERPVFEQRWAKLLAAFPASFPDDAARAARRALWVELLDAHAWITEPVFRRGATLVAFGHKGDFLPEPASALDYFREAAAQIALEEQKALPAPAAAGQGWFRQASREQVWEVFARNYLEAKAAIRKRFALIDAYRREHGLPAAVGVPEEVWRGQDKPTEEELAAVRRGMARETWWRERDPAGGRGRIGGARQG